MALALAAMWMAPALPGRAQSAAAGDADGVAPRRSNLPPRVTQAQRFLAQRGWTRARAGHLGRRGRAAVSQSQTPATATWLPLGPSAAITPEFGLVTGRVSALAMNPLDATGNCLYVGTTGGGVWLANNAGASSAASVVFNPLTDMVGALSGAQDASISIGALTVQPGTEPACGTTGVILAGTGDPNDNLDSYYGVGILRSADGGKTWSLISRTMDVEDGLSGQDFGFAGEGFAGFAWSTVNPQQVVAAVSQAREGVLVDADRPALSYEGLYYSSDAGVTWHLATITDGNGSDVQGPAYEYALGQTDGNAATSVVWNPVRKLFVAAVRFHGYYQSSDGVIWKRMAAQPGSGLTVAACPTNFGSIGSSGCPIFRGTLAVNPQTGDTFAWTVDVNNQDQGLWQDQCGMSGGACASQSIAFGTQLTTSLLEMNTSQGPATIENGDYTLALAAVPSGQDTLLLAGGNDLWKCSLAMGCQWRNTTNATVGFCAQVAPYQHALAWGGAADPLEIFVGNDSGLWRSQDAIGESGSACAATDAQHFQNLNGSLGSLAEAVSISQVISTPYTMMAGLGANGTAGANNPAGATADWPQILDGDGGPVAIDPKTTTNWYVNNAAGVSIYLGTPPTGATPGAFRPVLTYSSDAPNMPEVVEDGLTMPAPAPFLVDPADASQLLIGTCRVWRGPADGSGWSAGNAISPVFDDQAFAGPCAGDALIRSMAAAALPSGGEVVYVGMYGSANGNARLPGHIWSAAFTPAGGAMPVWTDLTLNSVTNDGKPMNAYGLDISSIFIDSTHDTSGKTVYVTVEGIANVFEESQMLYRSTDGGAHWTNMTANLPWAPANSVAVDPQSANTVYVATDVGVYFTTQIATCANLPPICWSAFGTGLPASPVVELAAAPLTASAPVLVAATYGRGIWQTPLWTAETGLTTALASPSPLDFPIPVPVSTSSSMTVTLENTGTLPLLPTSIAVSGDFTETDACQGQTVPVGASCAITVTFAPTVAGTLPLLGQMTVYANVYGGQLSVELSGTGAPSGTVTLTPATLSFGVAPGQSSSLPPVPVNTTSAPQQVEAGNSSNTAVGISSVAITAPFTIVSNACGTSTLAPQTDCQVKVAFAPTQRGAAAGTLTFTDGAGSQTVQLSGWGSAPPTDILNPASLTFPGTIIGQLSAAQTVGLANIGDLPLTGIAIAVSGPFTESDNCNGQLAAGSNCSISVQYAPTAAGTQTGTLTVADVTRAQAQTVALSGTGLLPPELGVSPASLSFTGQPVGVASPPATLTVTNTGGAPLANVGFQITGPAASSFTIGATTCGAALNNGSSCTVQVVFTPAAASGGTATLTISSSTLGVAAVQVPLNGNGTTATGLSASPLQLTFAATIAGQSSAAQTVTVTNTGSYSAASLALTLASPFSLTQDACSGQSLAAGANCTAGVIFTPTASGAATGTLTVASASVLTPATVALSGTGELPFDFTIAVSGSSTQTVASGQTASYTLSIAPVQNAPGGTFTFQCGTLPSYALCLFNPASETVNAGASGTVLVQISTGHSSSARSGGANNWRVLPLACGLVLLPLAWRRRRKTLLLAALLAIMAGGVSSCAGSGGGTGGSGGLTGIDVTPPGTYSLSVTATAGGVQKSVPLTLTVD